MSERKFASIYPYETKAGTRWYFSFRDARGRQSKRRGFTSPEAADAARNDMHAAVGPDRVLVTSCRFDTWFHLWLAARERAVPLHTHKTYTRFGHAYFGWFAQKQLAAITRDDIAAWLYDLYAGGLPANKANEVHRVLRGCLDDATIAGHLPSNPAREVPPLNMPAKYTKPQGGRRRQIRGGLAS